MRKHELLSHVADVRLRVHGDSLAEIFTAGLEGMGELMKPGICEEKTEMKEELELTSSDTTTLLIDFLAEALTRSHVNRTVVCQVNFEELTETWLKATIRGVRVEGFDEDIKAVTYHEAEVEKDKDGVYVSTIIFDI